MPNRVFYRIYNNGQPSQISLVKFPTRFWKASPGLGFLIFAVVLLLRLFVLARLASSPFLLPSRGDMHFYNDWAQRILHGQMETHFAFYGLPGYAYLLALLYKIFGYNLFLPGLLQSVLDALTAVLIYQLTLQVSPSAKSLRQALIPRLSSSESLMQVRVTGAAAAIGWALFVPAQAYAAILMPTIWFVFFFWFVIWRIVRSDDAPGTKECLWLGLLIGVVAMGVATILVLIPLMFAALVVKSNPAGRWRTVAKRGAILFGAVLIGTSPCWIHNYFIARDPVFLSAHSGINFWIGNNPEANGYPRFPPGLRAGQAAMLQDSITQAEAAAGRSLKRAEVSAYWSARATNYIKGHFREWLKLLAIKLRNFWNAFQYDDLSIITNLREQGVILPGLYFSIVAALAIPGILFGWRVAPASRWVTAAILLSMLSLLPVFITERYRLVAVPGLLIFATLGLSILWRACACSRVATVAAYVGLLAASAFFVAWPQRDPSLWALDAYNSGWQALESNDLPLAEKKLAIAYAYVPENSETVFALGNLRLAEGRPDEAAAFYRSVIQIDPKHKGALNNLGVVRLQSQRFLEAEHFFERALQQAPRDAKSHYLLAKALLGLGETERAKIEISRAMALEPNQREFLELGEQIGAGPMHR
jgi:Tetratricopeptide repeat